MSVNIVKQGEEVFVQATDPRAKKDSSKVSNPIRIPVASEAEAKDLKAALEAAEQEIIKGTKTPAQGKKIDTAV